MNERTKEWMAVIAMLVIIVILASVVFVLVSDLGEGGCEDYPDQEGCFQNEDLQGGDNNETSDPSAPEGQMTRLNTNLRRG